MTSAFPSIFQAVLPLVAVIALVLSLVGIRFGIRRFLHRRKRLAPIERCKCGYAIEGLPSARCPECGRVFGFNVTAEDLGLTDAELQRAQAARLKRKGDAG